MGGVVDVERLAGAVARGHALDLEGEDARDVGGAAQALGGEADVAELDAAEVAHQVVADHLRRATGLSAHDVRERAALGFVGPGIDDAAEYPAAVRHDPAGADDQGELQAVEHDVAVAAAIDAVDHERDAVLVRGLALRVGEDAGAEIVAIATLHVLAADLPGLLSHDDPAVVRSADCSRHSSEMRHLTAVTRRGGYPALTVARGL
jgi:hypothetical protein